MFLLLTWSNKNFQAKTQKKKEKKDKWKIKTKKRQINKLSNLTHTRQGRRNIILNNNIIIVYPYLFVWFVGFYGISAFEGYLTPNSFLCK